MGALFGCGLLLGSVLAAQAPEARTPARFGVERARIVPAPGAQRYRLWLAPQATLAPRYGLAVAKTAAASCSAADALRLFRDGFEN